MTQNNGLARAENGALAMAGGDVVKLGHVLYDSGYFKDVGSAAQAIVKVLRGQELGIGPISALENIYVIEGKTSISYTLIGAQIKKSGRYDYRVTGETDSHCEITFYERGEAIGTSSFSMDDAKAAGLTDRQMWKKYRSTMLFARALSAGARKYTPDVFGGAIYTPEELEDIQAIDAPVVSVQTRQTSAPKVSAGGSPKRAQMEARYAALVLEAQTLGVEFTELDYDWTDAILESTGRKLADAIKAAKDAEAEGVASEMFLESRDVEPIGT